MKEKSKLPNLNLEMQDLNPGKHKWGGSSPTNLIKGNGNKIIMSLELCIVAIIAADGVSGPLGEIVWGMDRSP